MSVFLFLLSSKALNKNKYNKLLVCNSHVLFSNQYSRRFFWPRLSVKPRQDLIAVTLRGFSQFPTELRPLSVLSVQAQSLGPSACSLGFPSPQGTVQQWFSKPRCCLLMCFYQHDKVSVEVPVAKDTTNKRATVLDATGHRWMKYSGHLLLFQ